MTRGGLQSLSPVLSLIAGVAIGSAGTVFLTSRRLLPFKKKKYGHQGTADSKFTIDSSLSQGNVEIVKLPLCQVLLCDDSRFQGWLILVPRKDNLKEVIDLSEEGQEVLWKEVGSALRVIKRVFTVDKLNVSAVGNICSQLHIHVTGRRRRDAAWPNVHLGFGGKEPYAYEELQSVRQKLIEAFKEDAESAVVIEEED